MKFSRMQDTTRGVKAMCATSTPPSNSTQDAAALLAKYNQLPYSESGVLASDTTSTYISVSHDGTTLNVSSANYSPGMCSHY